ncbi:MAG: hypothetical protein D3910_28825 [Candidatus Electrothrix sp. ATG2]|nr:hypothetical protein [Candidatus Electrothrix sp. ATG2]
MKKNSSGRYEIQQLDSCGAVGRVLKSWNSLKWLCEEGLKANYFFCGRVRVYDNATGESISSNTAVNIANGLVTIDDLVEWGDIPPDMVKEMADINQ